MKTVHENSNPNPNSNLNRMKSDAAKFASIINNQSTGKTKNNSNKIAGINLDQNQFLELANLKGRFWDANSNANESGRNNPAKSVRSTKPLKMFQIWVQVIF